MISLQEAIATNMHPVEFVAQKHLGYRYQTENAISAAYNTHAVIGWIGWSGTYEAFVEYFEGHLRKYHPTLLRPKLKFRRIKCKSTE